MNEKDRVIRGWIQKAEGDTAALNLLLEGEETLDAACFHAQQLAEKYLKAYLTLVDLPFPFIHNVEKLLDLCARRDEAFSALRTVGQALTPYATELRYDSEFWPTRDVALEARDGALTIRQFVLERLPPDLAP